MKLFTKAVVQLRDALSVLVPDKKQAISILNAAGISRSNIDIDGSPIVMWNEIIQYTAANEQTDDLVNVALEYFPKNAHLLTYRDHTMTDHNPGPDIRKTEWKDLDDANGYEEIIERTSTLLPVRFLAIGLTCSRAVAKITSNYGGRNCAGTGFLIAGNLIVTNHHVLPEASSAANAVVTFGFEESEEGLAAESQDFRLAPEICFKTSLTDDWTIVAVSGDANTGYGMLQLSDGQVKKGDNVNIIQHPGGRYKQIALYHNIVTYADENIVQYLTDTEPGSSGSPVFNNSWEVVALHHSGGMLREPNLPHKVMRNEGIAANKIINALISITQNAG
ncbi:trypsin-like peptidase domain-containing protein [Mucilaginibacter sp.]|uniref:trypsin-like peptidase domain-containing protein n=1 Tax=Mucilaginibacter sp. TaxID=1882438 RepID=UPI0035BC3F52